MTRVAHLSRRTRLANGVRPWAAAVALAALTAAGCSSTASSTADAAGTSASSGKKATINYWTFADFTQGKAGELQKEMVADFEKKNPNITVNLVGKPAQDIITGITANAGQSSGPDVVTTQLAAGSPLVYQGLLADVADRWRQAGSSYTDQFTKDTVSLLSQGGKVWGVPYTAYATVLYRNLTVLKKAGIEPAAGIKDWPDWLAQMQKVKAAGASAIANPFAANSFPITSLYAGASGRTQFALSPDGKSVTLDGDALTAALTFMKETLPSAANVPSGGQSETDLFTSNKLAFMISGPWSDGTLSAAAGLKYDYVMVPGETPGVHGGTRGGEFMAIPAASKHRNEDWKFLQFMTDKAELTKFAAGVGRLVGNDAVMQEPSVSSNALASLTFKAFPGAVNESPLIANVPAGAGAALFDPLSKGATGDPAKVAKAIIDGYNAGLQQ